MTTIAQIVVLIFGTYLIRMGFLMLLAPVRAREVLRKAGSTNFINYFEITIRMIPATGMILYAEFSKYPEFFNLFGWFMLLTSFVLYFVPRCVHHNYALKCADILKSSYITLISPFSMMFGAAIIYCAI